MKEPGYHMLEHVMRGQELAVATGLSVAEVR